MQKNPKSEERFDSYEPQKYDCIQIDDDLIELIMMELQSVDCYWHTLQRMEKGLAYCGITLIPPKSMNAFIKVLSSHNSNAYIPLISLANQAEENGKYIIHYGI
ncbi:hypothetical protein [Tissierella creatinophila]|uniref:Uncharacterized protein n=1 Tax=Tissierella creatinophila DSM 6911 TaxID=1123403 RepID=A0A1U7M7I1_TISCR|nr:hypothetical protein [Tissierella creatinophila]OLS03283.1 hypothetical protein TICRE_07110 [Tissierella creatinophila DSM 6911]